MSEPSRQRTRIEAARDWLAGKLRGFDEADGGATLTEFVIVLPVFLILFAAIMRLTLLQSTTVQLKMAATNDVWRQAMNLQHGNGRPADHTERNSAQQTFTDSISASNRSRSFSDGLERDKARGLRRHGTLGEAGAALNQGATTVESQADMTFPRTTPQVDQRTRNVVLRPGVRYANQSGPTGDTLTRQLVDDGTATSAQAQTPPRPMNSGPINVNIPSSGTIASYATGARYGLVQPTPVTAPTSAVQKLPFIGPNDLRAGYNTLAAPNPILQGQGPSGDPEVFRPIGTIRQFMESHRTFRNIMGIQLDPSRNPLPIPPP